MSSPAKVSPLTCALALLAAILVTALLLQGWHGSHATAILNTPPRNITLAPPPSEITLTDDLQIIQDHALFYATRKFYVPVLAAPLAARSELSSYQLVGTLILPRKPGVAFLRRGDATTAVSPGDHLDSWTVEAVQAGSTVFGYGDQRVTLNTTLPFGSTSAAQSIGIIRLPITRPAQGRANAALASQEPTRLNPHPPHSPRDRARGQ
jgi:hypothetical protein